MKFAPDRTARHSYFRRLFVTMSLEEIVIRRQKFYAILIPGIPISSECEHPSEFPSETTSHRAEWKNGRGLETIKGQCGIIVKYVSGNHQHGHFTLAKGKFNFE